jgi:hypothetical protein
MKFGPVPVGDAEGGIAVHSIRKGAMVLKKGTAIPPSASSTGTGPNFMAPSPPAAAAAP